MDPSAGHRAKHRGKARPTGRRAFVPGLLAFALLAGPLGIGAAPAAPRQDLAVIELTEMAQLQARFNADFGKPRLLLLLSPT